jgi:hypothetical protein
MDCHAAYAARNDDFISMDRHGLRPRDDDVHLCEARQSITENARTMHCRGARTDHDSWAKPSSLRGPKGRGNPCRCRVPPRPEDLAAKGAFLAMTISSAWIATAYGLAMTTFIRANHGNPNDELNNSPIPLFIVCTP